LTKKKLYIVYLLLKHQDAFLGKYYDAVSDHSGFFLGRLKTKSDLSYRAEIPGLHTQG